jgi:hypothetical protein
MLALAQQYTPNQIGMVLIDPSDTTRRFFNIGTGENTLDALPHVLATVTNAKEFDAMVLRLNAEFNEQWGEALKTHAKDTFAPDPAHAQRAIVALIDHYDDIAGMLRGSKYGITGLAEAGKGKAMHIVFCGSLGVLRGATDDLRKRVETSRYSLVLQDFEPVRSMGVRNMKPPARELPPGRGFVVKAVNASLVQIAMPALDGRNGKSLEEHMGDAVRLIRRRNRDTAKWNYVGNDMTPLEILAAGKSLDAAATQPTTDTKPATSPSTNALSSTPVAPSAAQTALREQLASTNTGPSLKDMMSQFKSQMPTQVNLRKLEVEVPDKPDKKTEEG